MAEEEEEEEWLTLLHRRGSLEREWSWSEYCPSEILSLILSKLFFRDSRNFRMVCRSWNLIRPIRPPLLPPPVDSPLFDSPCLIFSQRSSHSHSHTRWKLFHSVYNDFYYLDFPEEEELKDAEIHCSNYGWLLMSRDKCPLFFFNPFTKEKLHLPPTPHPFYSVCFTSPPTDSSCFVFGIFCTSSWDDVDLGHIKVGDDDWKFETLDNGQHQFRYSNHPPLSHNGMYYCLDYGSRNIFRIFDPMKDHQEYRWIHCGEEDDEDEGDQEEDDEDEGDQEEDDVKVDEDEGDLEEDEEDDYESYIAELDGSICGVFVGKEDGRVSVGKWDFEEMGWKKLESLGEKCLYVSPTGSFAETCNISGMANNIYFNNFHAKSGVFYSLTTGKYHSVEGSFASNKAYGLIQMDYGAWIKPSLHKIRHTQTDGSSSTMAPSTPH